MVQYCLPSSANSGLGGPQNKAALYTLTEARSVIIVKTTHTHTQFIEVYPNASHKSFNYNSWKRMGHSETVRDSISIERKDTKRNTRGLQHTYLYIHIFDFAQDYGIIL